MKISSDKTAQTEPQDIPYVTYSQKRIHIKGHEWIQYGIMYEYYSKSVILYFGCVPGIYGRICMRNTAWYHCL